MKPPNSSANKNLSPFTSAPDRGSLSPALETYLVRNHPVEFHRGTVIDDIEDNLLNAEVLPKLHRSVSVEPRTESRG